MAFVEFAADRLHQRVVARLAAQRRHAVGDAGGERQTGGDAGIGLEEERVEHREA